MAAPRPRTSSPLNPRQDRPPAASPQSAWPRRHVGVSPTERLQRYKGLQAWRRHVMEEARTDEKAMVEAIQEREDAVERRHALDGKDLVGVVGSEQHFQLPEFDFFAPRRVALAVGLMKRLPALKRWGVV